MNYIGTCPICDSLVYPGDGTTEHEIIYCDECDSRLVVEEVIREVVYLRLAPAIEEDWGE